MAALPGKGTGLIQAVYLDVSNTKTKNFCLSLEKNLSGTVGIVHDVLPELGKLMTLGFPLGNRELKNQDGPLLLHSKKEKCSFSFSLA